MLRYLHFQGDTTNLNFALVAVTVGTDGKCELDATLGPLPEKFNTDTKHLAHAPRESLHVCPTIGAGSTVSASTDL